MATAWPIIIFIYVLVVAWLALPNVRQPDFARGCLLPALFFPVTIPAIIARAAFYHYFFQEHVLRKKLKKQGRLMTGTPKPGCGTILVDTATVNHYRTRVWWTADDVAEISQHPVAPGWFTNEHSLDPDSPDTYRWPPFEKWIWNQYLNPKIGQAKLLMSTLSQSPIDKIKAKFPGCAVVETFSGGRILEFGFANVNDDPMP